MESKAQSIGLVILIISLSSFSIVSSINANAITLSPRQQMASGIDADEVTCKGGFALMIRSTNGAAACVTPSTASVLEERGWGTIIQVEPITEEQPLSKEVNLEERLSMDTEESEPEEESETKKVSIEDEVAGESEEAETEENP